MPGKFSYPSALSPETHPYALQPGAKVVEGFEIPAERLQVEPCEGGVRIASLDDRRRSYSSQDMKGSQVTRLEGPICIPSHINGEPVVEIASIAFSELGEVTKVIIPAGVRFINQRAFYDCPKLKSATIYMTGPDSVQVMGNAFPPGCVVTYAQRPQDVQTGVKRLVGGIVG